MQTFVCIAGVDPVLQEEQVLDLWEGVGSVAFPGDRE